MDLKYFKPWLILDPDESTYYCLACPTFDDPEKVQAFKVKRQKKNKRGAAAKFLQRHMHCGFAMA